MHPNFDTALHEAKATANLYTSPGFFIVCGAGLYSWELFLVPEQRAPNGEQMLDTRTWEMVRVKVVGRYVRWNGGWLREDLE